MAVLNVHNCAEVLSSDTRKKFTEEPFLQIKLYIPTGLAVLCWNKRKKENMENKGKMYDLKHSLFLEKSNAVHQAF